jgi:hypothetical protein
MIAAKPKRPANRRFVMSVSSVCVWLERFQAKWVPVRVKKTRQIKNLELRSDFIGTEMALGRAQKFRVIGGHPGWCAFPTALASCRAAGR